MKKRYLFIVLIILSFLSVFIGVEDVSPFDVMNWTEREIEILVVSRIPRLMSILIAGMSLSICGMIMQQLSRNKFVSPTTAGTMDSARFGILMSMMFFAGASSFVRVSVAFVFALLGTLIFMRILDRIKLKDPVFIPLVGLMFGSIVNSVTTFFAYQNDLIQNMGAWLHGDFSMILRGQYELIFVSVPALIIAFFFANKFTVAGMGEEFATNLGLNHRQVVNLGLIIVALVTSVVVLTVGMIPFLGLIVPNIVSIFQGDNMKKSIGQVALLGAVFILFCDILGRVIIYPYEISIGLTVGVIGSGIFIYLLLRGRAYGS